MQESIHVASQSKVDHLVQQARAQQATARPCLRGKHTNRPNRLLQEKVDMIKEHNPVISGGKQSL